MENSIQALLMAFAVLLFVIALTVTFSTLAQAKQTADVVLYYSDRENFQDLVKVNASDYQDGGRTVGLDTVISTIARCGKEKFSVKVLDKNGNLLKDSKGNEFIFEYDVMKTPEIKERINQFIKYINEQSNYQSKPLEFRETYVEATTSGQVFSGEDGTALEQNTGKKLYITYKINN